MLDLNEAVWRNSVFAKKAAKLRDAIRSGIETYGIIDLGKYVLRIYICTYMATYSGWYIVVAIVCKYSIVLALATFHQCTDILCSAGKVYAYEVDGLGNNRHDFDDANVPSLLAIPVLGYKYYDKKIYQNTRDRLLRFVLGVVWLYDRAQDVQLRAHRKDACWKVTRLVKGAASRLRRPLSS